MIDAGTPPPSLAPPTVLAARTACTAASATTPAESDVAPNNRLHKPLLVLLPVKSPTVRGGKACIAVDAIVGTSPTLRAVPIARPHGMAPQHGENINARNALGATSPRGPAAARLAGLGERGTSLSTVPPQGALARWRSRGLHRTRGSRTARMGATIHALNLKVVRRYDFASTRGDTGGGQGGLPLRERNMWTQKPPKETHMVENLSSRPSAAQIQETDAATHCQCCGGWFMPTKLGGAVVGLAGHGGARATRRAEAET
ncbi:hypothetical protein K438DRAFT_1761534 [Mycena galopus ATCC 62051]|nr:hypothetical protein K438DRAFT_1761534 [Mycena galopus ATCC 62051]